jgi:hypothetical protein
MARRATPSPRSGNLPAMTTVPLARRRLALAVGLATAISLSACGAAEKQDAPHVDATNVDRSRPDLVIAMPDDYRNVVSKCDRRGHRVFVTSHDADQPSAIAVIDDASCRGQR